MILSAEDLLRIDIINGYNLHLLHRRKFTGVSTDSRTVKRGEIFFALRGESFDGHQFIHRAFTHGAACAVVEWDSTLKDLTDKPLLVVRDTLKAFGRLAGLYRRKFHIPFIAVAGSNGKTTTKEMITAVLSNRYSVLSTSGNLNNHIGVPQTLFRLKRDHDIAVVEIGTNHFGELHYLCEILQPTHGIITNIGREHMEYFKTLAGVARAEGELLDALTESGLSYINLDDPYVAARSRRLKKKFSYGFSSPRSDVRGKLKSVGADGCARFSFTMQRSKTYDVRLSVPGKHVMENGLAAAAVGISHGVSPRNIQDTLKRFAAVGKRMEVITAGDVKIVNDTYNANPDSVLSALETIERMECKGKKIVILADMLELGKVSRMEHQRIGRAISRMKFQHVLTFGRHARQMNEHAHAEINKHFQGKEELIRYAKHILSPGDLVLVKGSRGMKMEEVVHHLQQYLRRRAA